MRKILLFVIVILLSVGSTIAQTFTDSSSDLPEGLNSGGCVAVTDMNGDGFDDILTLDGSSDIVIFYQNLDGVPGLTMRTFGSLSDNNQWGMAVADINNDGHKDVFAGGSYDGVHYCQITDPDNHELIELNEQMYMQCVNIADINNDGWLDAFGCHDDAESNIWSNDGSGSLELANDLIDMATTPVSDNSGNYGSVWSDYDNDNDLDLFIAKCRQSVNNPTDPRRINAAFINDGNNNYSDEALDRGLVVYEQSWTVDFADTDNDGDFDCLLTNHSTNMMLLENDGKGFFTDISSGSGIDVTGFFLQAKMVDFDNDGYVDLITSGGAPGFYRNNGDNTFTDLNIDIILPGDDNLHSFGLGDLNRDGYLDIYASYGDTYVNPDYDHDDRLWLNDGGDNNWIGFDLEGLESNKDAIGAKIQIYGDFGTQIREVRSGESYGITNSNQVHFGLGSSSTVDYAVIKWPAGNVTVIEAAPIGEYHFVEETSCDASAVMASATSTLLCAGETSTVSVDASGIILWNNGMVSTAIEVSTTGNYSAVVVDANGCASLSNTVCVGEEEEIIPVITSSGNIEVCEGESVTLSAPNAASFAWSNDADTQIIEVTESGAYSVMLGTCGTDVESNTIEVTIYASPDSDPTSEDVSVVAGQIELTATGDDLVWFGDAAGENEIGTGSPITIDVTSGTIVYVANQEIYGNVASGNGGKETTSEPGQYHNNSDNGLVFTANEDMIIDDVKVYADGSGNRTIVLYNSSFQVVESQEFDIPDGESVVELDFFVPAGEDYILITDENNPQLWRDAVGSGVDYPYELGDLGSITGSTVDGTNEFTYYYFFYDWNVSTAPTTCYSDLVPVVITISGIEDFEAISSFSIYPNPATTEIRYEYNAVNAGRMFISLIDANGRSVYKDYIESQVGSHQGVISLTDFSPGMYTFTLVENGKIASEKIIIE